MRLHFQARPWDLYLVFIYLAAMAVVLLPRDVGLLPAILLVLFVPGYVLVAALFPRGGRSAEGLEEGVEAGADVEEEDRQSGELDWIERIALSLGLSIAVVPLLGLLLNFTPFGIRYHPIVITMLLFSGGVGAAAYWRRMQLPVGERLAGTLEVGWPAWREYSALDKALTVALVASLVVAGGVLAYVATTPRPGETFTEFFVLDADERIPELPLTLNASQETDLLLGVANHEFARVNYTIRVDLYRLVEVPNATSGENDTVPEYDATLAWFNRSLEHEEEWEQPYALAISDPGLWQVRMLLFRDGDLESVYRGPLTLPVQVS